ncbi:MAG TPA: T9SS type A sorting domain-containing protein [Chitinophagaceae bacterium]|nr:T9SS type A sorting domain-containing protein [Chitinophagaceae bacterium]
MPTLRFLRVCLCSAFILFIVLDTNAQRAARRRVATPTDTTKGEFLVVSQHVKVDNDVRTPSIDPLDQDIQLKIPGKETSVPNCRETNGINQPGIADAYPFLSPDGLRLYFTSSRGGGFGRIFISTRKSTDAAFGKPEPLSKNITGGYFAASLTNDELTICMVESGDLYISTRSDRSKEFPEPVKVSGTDGNNHYGPSISFDGKEIISNIEVNGKDRIRIYKRTGTYQVEKVKDIVLPSGQESGPGQLSKDGLSYYFSIATKKSEHLWRYTRKSVADEFGNLTEIPDPRKGLRNMIQPSFNSDGSLMVFVTAAKDLWEYDDILLIGKPKKQIELPKIPDVKALAGNTVKPLQKIQSPKPSLERPAPVDVLEIVEISEEVSEPDPVEADNRRDVFSRKIVSNAEGITDNSVVYPNPFKNYVNIQIKELPANGAMLTLYDLSGKSIRQQKLNNLNTRIFLGQLAAGIYTYRVTDQKGQSIAFGKLVKGE